MRTQTQLVNACVKEEIMDFSSIPPGFEPLAPFTLKKVEANEMRARYSASSFLPESQAGWAATDLESSDDGKKSLRRKPSVNYGEFDDSSGEESDFEQNQSRRLQLPKGVIRGCEECSNCQKVTVHWRPEEACRPSLEDAPVFHPTEEEFEDTLKYIASIRSKAEAYGICRIVPPPSWRPPCPLKDIKVWESSKFCTRVQRIDKLQNRNSLRNIAKINCSKKIKRRRCMKNGVDHGNVNGEIGIPTKVGNYGAESFGFEPGPYFTLDAFQKYANDFKAQYFRRNNSVADARVSLNMSQLEPSVQDIEGEYWRMVGKPTAEIEVLYGADLETGAFGSGFPKCCNQVGSTSEMKYVSSGWNLNNFPRLPGSVLSYESSDISGVLVPWLYVGMCFSSFCWHVEDHHLYSMNYMHWGAPKMWYGVPGADASKLEAAMRKHLPDLFEEQPDLLHKLVTQLSPSILRSAGVPVYRCVQNSGEFVLTFPRAYHAGFNCGFNCAEAVNVAPIDWLPHGQNAIELYREHGRKTSISHDKLLLGAARDAVKALWELSFLRNNTANNLRWKGVCGTDGILTKTVKVRVEMERVRREFLCKSSRALKMESNFDATNERECIVCFFDLHMSASGCQNCSLDKYACLHHAKQLCSCSWGAKFFLFRYDINELNVLVEALEGKLGSVYRWAKLDLGLALNTYVTKESLLVSSQSGKSSDVPGSPAKNTSSQLASASVKEEKENEMSEKQCGGFSALKKSHVSSISYKSSHEVECKEEVLQSAPDSKDSVCQLTQEKSGGSLALQAPEVKRPPSVPGNGVIPLSDEGEESSKHVEPSNGTQTPDNSVHKPVISNVVSDIIDSSLDSECMKQNSASNTGLDNLKGDMRLPCNATEYSCHGLSSSHINSDMIVQNFPSARKSPDSSQPIAGNDLGVLQSSTGVKPNNEYGQQRLVGDASSRSMDDAAPSVSNRNHQIGPRVAKMVRRINCNVEPLEFGVVKPGNFWCDGRAIYPKGFRSRVRYINARDPANMCYYVSEILDAGQDRPLFMVSLEHCLSEVFIHTSAGKCWEMVSLEHCLSEVFIHTSAGKCWEMVLERVNQEITKQHKLGKKRLPPLQPPGSLDGMEMFGFSTPAIMQVIQGMDRNHVCTAYWKSRPLMQISQQSQSTDNLKNSPGKSKTSNSNDQTSKGQPPPAGTDPILNGLFTKASLEELRALYDVLSTDTSSSHHQQSVSRLLSEEINKRSR